MPCIRGLSLASQGQEYQMFWPEKSEFVRIAASCNASIVPFAAVGSADRYTPCSSYRFSPLGLHYDGIRDENSMLCSRQQHMFNIRTLFLNTWVPISGKQCFCPCNIIVLYTVHLPTTAKELTKTSLWRSIICSRSL